MQHGSISKQYGDGAASRRDRHHHRHHHHRHRDRDNTEEEEEEDNTGCRRSSRDGTKTKLTAEEEQLYAKAKEFLKRNDEADENIDKEEEDRRHHHRHHHRKHHLSVDRHRRHHHREDEKRHRHRRSSRKDDYDDDDDDDDDDDSDERRRSRRHRREKSKKHKHSRRNHHSHRSHHGDDNHRNNDDDKDEDRRQKKRNKRMHTTSSHKTIYTGDEEFKNKSSPIDNTVHLVPLGNILGNPPIDGKKLDAESDYFSYNAHLRLYLYRTYGIYFEDLTSAESHCAFAEFTKLYNAGMLEEAYYSTDGTNSNNNLPLEAVEQCSRTKHKWTFRTNKLEEQSLQLVRAGVKKQTEYTASTADHGIGRSSSSSIYTTTVKLGGSIGTEKATDPTKQNTTTGTTPNPQRKQLEYAQTVASQRQADKAHSERIKLAYEEIHGITSGKADKGWEHMREKKRERSEKLHGAHRERESEGWELNDDDIYGTSTGGRIVAGGGKRRSGGSRGDVSFDEAIAKERQFRERKEAESEVRRAGLLEKEAERQKKMFEALGLSGMMKPGEKITIAPRNDTPG